jgi:alkanesulfonate monooxygenase SsuD/methylene tetrahydromethanopterin reductase-like flavin-dependent oxidoreductase (luciferase family)
MMQGHAVVLTAAAKRYAMTLRELRDFAIAGTGHRVVYGSPADIADDLTEWFANGAADGFIVKTSHVPGPVDDFIDKVVPILQGRGLFRTDYAGKTLRDHLGLEKPAHPGRG